MEMTISRQFAILSLHPERGTISIDSTYFRFGLAGAALIDLYLRGEIREENKRLLISTGTSGDPLHDRLMGIMSEASRPRKIIYWIRKLSWKHRQNLLDTLSILISNGSIRHEKKYFLGIFSYNRYYINDPGIRNSIIQDLREVVINGKSPETQQLMLLGLMKAANSLKLLAFQYSERAAIRSKVKDLLRKDEYMSEQQKFTALVMSAVSLAIAADEATHTS